MRYIKEILKNNRIWVLAYIGLGIFNAFMANYKTDYFQKVIDGLATGTLTFAGVITYGLILLVNYCMNYLDNYPEKKLSMVFIWILSFCRLENKYNRLYGISENRYWKTCSKDREWLIRRQKCSIQFLVTFDS